MIYLGLFLLSASTLVFEINLTRLFSIAQFYHFAFMIVSLALLGFGASGSALALFSQWGRRHTRQTLAWLALGLSLSSIGSYILTNQLPFDSFSIAWDRRQVLLLALHYLVLATPFFCGGAATGLLLAAQPARAARTYFVNLTGSAAGCLLALIAPRYLGGEGVVLLSSTLAALAALLLWAHEGVKRQALPALTLLALLAALLLRPPFLTIRLSPYKDLSYALNVPDAKIIWQRWSAFARVDLVSSPAIRSFPGLSYRYAGSLPRQQGLSIDGDDMSGVVTTPDDAGFTGYLPGALAYHLRPQANALVLEPHGGPDVLLAHVQGARAITAVEPNPLVVQAARLPYALPRVQTIIQSGRSYARGAARRFDVVTLPLIAPYRPVRSGAYSLAEDYRYTVEAFADYVSLLSPGGILQATRWLQTPPSEETRLFALAVAALERRAVDPGRALLFFRGYNTATLLVKPDGFTPDEMGQVRAWLAERAFDLVYAPDVHPEEVNRFNRLPAPLYYQAATGLLSAPDRAAWFDDFAFDVTPPTDDHPFFGHYFKWRQAAQVLGKVGQIWQPFGGAGYFVLLVLLALALVAALVVILLPLLAGRLTRARQDTSAPSPTAPVRWATLAYFGLIGLGFLMVEIPLAQRFILFLGQPVYGLTAVLFGLLFFSGWGSLVSARLPHRAMLAALVALVLIYPPLLSCLFDLFLGQGLGLRLLVTMLALAPLGFLLGVPLPRGIQRLERRSPALIPWAWGVNGAASVVSSVAAALLALSIGFSWVLVIGALCYGGALASVARQRD